MLDWILNPVSFQGTYNFHIEIHPKSIESNSNITITCYSNSKKGCVIPCAIRWFKIKHNVIMSLPDIKGNTYMCDPADIGSVLRAQIKSLDQEAGGVATVDMGPVKIDVLTKKNIQSVLSTGIGNFTVFLQGKSKDRQGSLRILDGSMILKDVVTENCYKFEYSVSDPRMEVHPKDNTKIIFRFSERYQTDLMKFLRASFGDNMPSLENKRNMVESRVQIGHSWIQVRFSSRAARDMLIFSYRAFLSRKQLRTAALLSKLQSIDLNNEDTFNFLMEIQSLKDDINRLLQVNKEHQKEKEVYQREVKRLEEEMERIILTYTKIVEDRCRNQAELSHNYSILTNKKQQIISKKHRNLEQENRQLVERVRQLEEQIELTKTGKASKISFQPPIFKKSPSGMELEMKIAQLSRINSCLADQNMRLKNQSQIVRQKTIDNILESLNESAVRETESANFNRQNQKLHKQLEISMRRTEHLEVQLNRMREQVNSANISRGMIQQAAMVDSSEIVKLRKQRDLLQSTKQNLEFQLDNVAKQNSQLKNKIISLQLQLDRKRQDSLEVVSLKNHVELLNRRLQQETSNKGDYSKLKRKMDELSQQNKMLKNGHDIMNKSRDLSMQMDSYYEQENNIIKQQVTMLTEENQRLVKMVEKYSKEAKQTTKLRAEIIQLRSENLQLKRELQSRSIVLLEEAAAMPPS